MHENTYIDLITKFYTTLDVNPNNTQILEFQMLGKQAFMRGEVVNSSFHFVQARTRSCWHGIACPSQVTES